MKFNEQKAWKVIRLFFPEQRRWVVRVLVVAGLSMLSVPLWEPYLNAFLARYIDLSVPSPNATFGWILLVLGIIGVIANEVVDRWPKRISVSVEDEADKKTLHGLFAELHLPTLDLFIHYGKLSMTYIPVLHYFSGLEAVVQASKYHVYDRQLKEGVERLYASLSKALSYGEYFTDTSNEKLQKFDSRHDVHADPRARGAHDAFIQAVYDTETHLRALCMTVRSKYPDFDLDATSRQALEDYRSYNEEAAAVSDWEFAVLAMIIRLEEVRDVPTLQRLAEVLDKPKVDVQVALDKMIKLGHVKHLYPGMTWQKFTALPDGRAYYVRHRDSAMECEDEQD